MTPATIRIRILQAQSTELRRIIAELKATPPSNVIELVNVCGEVQVELKAAITALQSVRDVRRSRVPSDMGDGLID